MRNAPFKIFVCALILSSFLVESSLYVQGPEILKKSFEATNRFNGLDYVVASSKYALTKSSFQGTLVAPDPIDGCKIIASDKITQNTNPVVIAREGECSFLQKARNAEIAGARMIVLALNQSSLEDYREYLKNFDYSSNIETLIINKQDGDRILDYINNQEKTTVLGPPTIKYTTELERHASYIPQADVVEVEYWFATSDIDEGSYVALEYLQWFKDQFKNTLKIKPHFVLWESDFAKYQGYAVNNPQCLSNGRYCDPEPDNIANLQGSESVLETLRQVCLGKVLPGKREDPLWWKYVIRFGNECIKSNVTNRKTNECRQKLLKEIELEKYTKQVDECMEKSFESSYDTKALDQISSDNLELKEELRIQKASYVSHYPHISVNRVKYTGNIYNLDAVKEYICSGLKPEVRPKACSNTEYVESSEPEGSTFWTSFWTLLFCSIIMFVLVYCVRRSVNPYRGGILSTRHTKLQPSTSLKNADVVFADLFLYFFPWSL